MNEDIYEDTVRLRYYGAIPVLLRYYQGIIGVCYVISCEVQFHINGNVLW